jgi:hypothetical protein
MSEATVDMAYAKSIVEAVEQGCNYEDKCLAVRDLLARHRQASVPVQGEPVAIPPDIAEQVLRMGRAEWGATEELTSEGHLAHLETSLRLTREHFNYSDIPVKMHGLYLEGTETILCHTGTSPNSPINAQALTGAWNWLHDQCQGVSTHAPTERERVLLEALKVLHHAVCGETGFAAAVRADSGLAYPWPALDIADELALAAIAQAQEPSNER